MKNLNKFIELIDLVEANWENIDFNFLQYTLSKDYRRTVAYTLEELKKLKGKVCLVGLWGLVTEEVMLDSVGNPYIPEVIEGSEYSSLEAATYSFAYYFGLSLKDAGFLTVDVWKPYKFNPTKYDAMVELRGFLALKILTERNED